LQSLRPTGDFSGFLLSLLFLLVWPRPKYLLRLGGSLLFPSPSLFFFVVSSFSPVPPSKTAQTCRASLWSAHPRFFFQLPFPVPGLTNLSFSLFMCLPPYLHWVASYFPRTVSFFFLGFLSVSPPDTQTFLFFLGTRLPFLEVLCLCISSPPRPTSPLPLPAMLSHSLPGSM